MWQAWGLHFNSNWSLWRDIVVYDAQGKEDMVPQGFITGVSIVILVKWCWFFLKTSKMKEKTLLVSPDIHPKIYIPKYFALFLLCFGISRVIGDTSTITAANTGRGSFVLLLLIPIILVAGIIKITLLKFGISLDSYFLKLQNLIEYWSPYLAYFLNIFAILFGVLIISALLFTLYKVLRGLSYQSSNEDKEDKEDRIMVNKLFKIVSEILGILFYFYICFFNYNFYIIY